VSTLLDVVGRAALAVGALAGYMVAMVTFWVSPMPFVLAGNAVLLTWHRPVVATGAVGCGGAGALWALVFNKR
jgi:hypothetical protein